MSSFRNRETMRYANVWSIIRLMITGALTTTTGAAIWTQALAKSELLWRVRIDRRGSRCTTRTTDNSCYPMVVIRVLGNDSHRQHHCDYEQTENQFPNPFLLGRVGRIVGRGRLTTRTNDTSAIVVVKCYYGRTLGRHMIILMFATYSARDRTTATAVI